jgi:hypothetical protein
MYGIDHCVHRSCLMNGVGHTKEGNTVPPHLCPVDLAKMKAAFGTRCRLQAHYRALLQFCDTQASPLFAAQAAWLRRALAVIDTNDWAVGGAPACDQGVSTSQPHPAAQSGISSVKHARPAPEAAVGARQVKKSKTKKAKDATHGPPLDLLAKENDGNCPAGAVSVDLTASSDEEDDMRPLAARLQARAQNR